MGILVCLYWDDSPSPNADRALHRNRRSDAISQASISQLVCFGPNYPFRDCRVDHQGVRAEPVQIFLAVLQTGFVLADRTRRDWRHRCLLVLPASPARQTIEPIEAQRTQSRLVLHFTHSATNTLVSCGFVAFRFEAKTILFPSDVNIGKPSKVWFIVI